MEYTWQHDNYLISTDKNKLDIEVIHAFLKNTYWANERTIDDIKVSIEHSRCFGLYVNDKQIGFARAITDFATFAYLADVFVLSSHQGAGLGKWLVETVLNFSELANVKTWVLSTKDAHGLYEKYGFHPLSYPDRIMARRK
jgi:GNAT superfamily N-acetyltransferase